MTRSWRLAHALAWTSLVANCLIVLTGAAVRLTGSGLGCPTWPKCDETSYVSHGELGLHGAIEFGNRLLTFVLALVAIVTLVVVVRARPRRRGPALLALALFLGIPAQAVIGGITVLTELNPWIVMLHLMCSLLLVAGSMRLVIRTREGDGPVTDLLPRPLRALSGGLLAVTLVVCYLGAIVTGSGPHAGDEESVRTGLDPDRMSQVHADGVFLLVGMTIAFVVAAYAVGAPDAVRRSAWVLLGVELAQGTVGFVQFFTGLPEVLVALHLVGATVLVAAATHLALVSRVRRELPGQSTPADPPPGEDQRSGAALAGRA